MSCVAGPDAVEDGLVIGVDAANTKSYPGTGTVLSDISGNARTHTLNSATFITDGNVKCFDSAAGNQNIRISSGSYTFTADYTITGWHKVKTDAVATTWRTLYRTNSYHPILIQDGTNLIGGYYNGFRSFGVTAATYEDTWVMYTITATGGNSTLYLNDELIASIAFNETGRLWTDIGFASQPPGLVATTSVYDRPLSADEITQNFIARKSRFGI